MVGAPGANNRSALFRKPPLVAGEPQILLCRSPTPEREQLCRQYLMNRKPFTKNCWPMVNPAPAVR